ncbi:hypothetical protein ABB37_04891 [Leptomonas pyrrhocoris]|uniref:Uncharacterized protein n=1 Tax=Leptomonas pyrrhocoris TaxID=157538 RepID=A0A0N0DVR2_LEPPY|nr:hypothetical protein ABB37_04891 [Leptomonas pyrrhocoris]KPA80722.1 hypothetical protein ABB37_04891 [Leptomonas pyrrhocoris]|eukprot:XP_015659161.1 hypothetical protein ABB37_04891 [Leptomonas pyrrhocoris]
MDFLPRSKDEPSVLRRQLLIELSVLRRRYAQLSDEVKDNQINEADSSNPRLHRGPAALLSGSVTSAEVEEDSGALGQSDRDAIEALFHSMDDFTREFNEGKGGLERDDIVSKIMRSNTPNP